jgi:hypothetical protein
MQGRIPLKREIRISLKFYFFIKIYTDCKLIQQFHMGQKAFEISRKV